MPTIEQVALGKGLQASAQDLPDWQAMRGSHGAAIKALADVAEVLIIDLQEQRDELLDALLTLKDWCAIDEHSDLWINSGARAAIAKALGENKE